MGSIQNRLSTLAPTPLLGKLQGGDTLLAYTRERLILLAPDEDRFIERHLIRRVYTPEAGRLGFIDSQGVLLLLVSSSPFSPEALRAFLHAMAANQPYGLEEAIVDSPPTPVDSTPSMVAVPEAEDPPLAASKAIDTFTDPPVPVIPIMTQANPAPSTHSSPDADDFATPDRILGRWRLVFRGLALLVIGLGLITVLNAQTDALSPAIQVWIMLVSLALGVILWRFNHS